MYTETVEYWDDLYPKSYEAVLPSYNLKLKSAKKIDDNTTMITITSNVIENLERFLNDLDDGELDTLDVISRSCNTDEDYVNQLKKYINNIKKQTNKKSNKKSNKK